MVQILDIPENETELAGWLESLLVSRDFGDLVSQLVFLGQGMARSEAIEITEETKKSVVSVGLSELSQEQCCHLLKNPDLLIELNERVFETGSDYWMGKLEPATADEAQFLKNSAVSLFSEQTVVNADRDQPAKAMRATKPASQSGISRRQLFAIAASILAVMCGVYLFQGQGSASDTPWGWQSAQAMPAGVSADVYLKSLAESAENWFAQESGTANMLASNLQSLSTGCQRVIDAPHQPLSPEHRVWLIEKCQLWKKDIDQLLVDAKAINDDGQLTVVKNAADDLVSKIALMLTNKSEEV